MIAIILIKKIVSLFTIMALGFLLVKLKVLKPKDSKVLSIFMLNLIIPCAIIMSFQVDYTEEIKDGLIFAFAIAIALHIALIFISFLLGKFLHYDGVERNSIIITNAGNLIIPIVIAILGSEWVVYSTAFMSVQLFVLWTYGKMTLCGEKKPDMKKIFTNVNLISVVVGLILFFGKIKIPAVFADSFQSIADMIGPAAMFVTGMLIAGMNFKQIFAYKRIWAITAFRLVIIPLITVAFFKFTGISNLVANGATILLISLLAMCTPSASSITQMAQIFNQDAEYASAINVITTLGCIVTMPVAVMLYQM